MKKENEIGLKKFPAFNIALGKTLIAAAWVDGELNHHELHCLKNLILTKLVVVDGHVCDKELECLRTIALYLEISQFVWVNALKNIVVKSYER